MRLLLFFDLPVEKVIQRREYTTFVKNIKRLGFYMLQESVYIKLSIDQQNATSVITSVKQFLPSSGSIFILTVTEKQFASMNILLGDNKSDIVNNDQRIVEL